MALVNLSSKERQLLETFTVQTSSAKALRRAQALLWLDEGESGEELTQRLVVSRRTVYYWVEHFARGGELEGASRLADAPRSGRPPLRKALLIRSLRRSSRQTRGSWGIAPQGGLPRCSASIAGRITQGRRPNAASVMRWSVWGLSGSDLARSCRGAPRRGGKPKGAQPGACWPPPHGQPHAG